MLLPQGGSIELQFRKILIAAAFSYFTQAQKEAVTSIVAVFNTEPIAGAVVPLALETRTSTDVPPELDSKELAKEIKGEAPHFSGKNFPFSYAKPLATLSIFARYLNRVRDTIEEISLPAELKAITKSYI